MSLSSFLFFALGVAFLVVGGDRLVRGASSLAKSAGVSSLVIGLTVVAFGTSAPELAVSMNGAFHHSSDVAVGNVVGSNIFNILAILGLSAVVTPLLVQTSLIRVEIPLLVAVSLAVPAMAYNGQVGRIEGLALFAGVVIYTVWVIRAARKANVDVDQEVVTDHWAKSLLSIVAGLALLVLGARWVVDGAVEIARYLGASELLISLTIVAAGTSLPEVVTSVSAAMKGERDIAVGNVIGSNLFNILCVLGLSALVNPDGIHVATQAMDFDIPVMIAVAIICIPIFISGYVVDRLEGVVLLALYAGYTATLIVSASGSTFAEAWRLIYVWGMWPLALLITVVWFVRARRRMASA